MSNNHFSYFRVKNFKRFKDLEVKDIGQFNLVLGDNNVGKTSLLEALLFNANSEAHANIDASIYRSLKNLIKALSFRNFGQITSTFLKYYQHVEAGDEGVSFETKQGGKLKITENRYSNTVYVEEINGEDDKDLFGSRLEVSFKLVAENSEYKPRKDVYIGKEPTLLNYNDIIKRTVIPLIPFQRSYDNEVAQLYIDFIQGNKILKGRYISGMRSLFSEIEDIELSFQDDEKTLIVNRSNSIFSLPLAYFGEGTIKAAKILSYLIRFRENQVLIDEIDTGVHYSRMKDYWKVILQSAKENDVQVFATTHNRECMESFKVALEELGAEYMDNARTITLKQSPKTGDIISYSNSFSVLQSAVELGNDLR